MKFLFLLLMLFCSTAKAFDFSEWHILELKQAYVDYMKDTHSSDPFLAPLYKADSRIDLGVDLDLFDKLLFMNNRINAETDSLQYRLIGWEYRVGIHLGDSVDFYFQHHSQHLLDYVPYLPNSYDAVGFRIYLYRAKQ